MGSPGVPSFKGLRVMVVDDDSLCLRVVEQMLRKCEYKPTTCTTGSNALKLLRGSPGSYDIVLSDVCMPDMDGFRLLETIGLEMDLPVIMMSSNGETATVLRGVTHGAVDFLIKPVRIEELRNLWQHVVRRSKQICSEEEHTPEHQEHSNGHRSAQPQDSEGHSQEAVKDEEGSRKRKEGSQELQQVGCRLSDEDALNASKRPRVTWSVDMHQRFVAAVNQLGVDKAVPKKILEILQEPGLTRENVASHLQKYRLFLKRLASQQGVPGAGVAQVGPPSSKAHSKGGGSSTSAGGAATGQAALTSPGASTCANSGLPSPPGLGAMQEGFMGQGAASQPAFHPASMLGSLGMLGAGGPGGMANPMGLVGMNALNPLGLPGLGGIPGLGNPLGLPGLAGLPHMAHMAHMGALNPLNPLGFMSPALSMGAVGMLPGMPRMPSGMLPQQLRSQSQHLQQQQQQLQQLQQQQLQQQQLQQQLAQAGLVCTGSGESAASPLQQQPSQQQQVPSMQLAQQPSLPTQATPAPTPPQRAPATQGHAASLVRASSCSGSVQGKGLGLGKSGSGVGLQGAGSGGRGGGGAEQGEASFAPLDLDLADSLDMLQEGQGPSDMAALLGTMDMLGCELGLQSGGAEGCKEPGMVDDLLSELFA